MKEKLLSHSPEYEELRELGQKLLDADSPRAAAVQEALTNIEREWELAHTRLHDKLQTDQRALGLWKQYEDSKATVIKAVEHVQPLVEEELVCLSQADLKTTIDKIKVCQTLCETPRLEFLS